MELQQISIMLTICGGLTQGQQSVVKVPNEPANLGLIKQQLIQYQSCAKPTCYVPQMEHQSDLAITLLKQGVATASPGEKLALVLDID